MILSTAGMACSDVLQTVLPEVLLYLEAHTGAQRSELICQLEGQLPADTNLLGLCVQSLQVTAPFSCYICVSDTDACVAAKGTL